MDDVRSCPYELVIINETSQLGTAYSKTDLCVLRCSQKISHAQDPNRKGKKKAIPAHVCKPVLFGTKVLQHICTRGEVEQC